MHTTNDSLDTVSMGMAGEAALGRKFEWGNIYKKHINVTLELVVLVGPYYMIF